VAWRPGSSDLIGLVLARPRGTVTRSQFTANHAGQINGGVRGWAAGRWGIAIAPAATSEGLTISGVVAYKLTGPENQVAVAFKLIDNSYRPVNTSPALLASLRGVNDDMNEDVLHSHLRRDTCVRSSQVR
jgi:hypothetical protein